MSTTWILEAVDAHGRWTEEACGEATGPSYTRFDSFGEAEAARVGLVALGEGWTDESTRVRDASVPVYARISARMIADAEAQS